MAKILSFLVITALAAAFIPALGEGGLTIDGAGLNAALSVTDIMDMCDITEEVYAQSSDEAHMIECFSLTDYLLDNGIDQASLKGIMLTGDDGSEVTMPDAILMTSDIYIASAYDGETLSAPMTAVSGAPAKYWVKGLTHIELIAQDGKTSASRVDLKLDENPSTGYSWRMTMNRDDILTVSADVYIQDDADPELVGVGGTRWWVFNSVAAGEVEIELVYARGDETDVTLRYICTVNDECNIVSFTQAQ